MEAWVEEPAIFLWKIHSILEGRVVFSFPICWKLRSLTWWLRLSLNARPVYLYNEKEASQLVEDAGWKFIEVNRLGRAYPVYGGTDSNSGN